MKSVFLKFVVVLFAVVSISKVRAQEQWTAVISPTGLNLNSVYFTSPNTGYVVGDSGSIFKTTNGGTSWTAQISGVTGKLTSVRFMDSVTGYVAGYGGVILKTTNGGNSWVSKPTGTTQNLASISCPNLNVCHAVGGGSIMVKTLNGGTSWTPESTGTAHVAYSVYFTDSSTGWLGVDYGIFKTVNGGATWTLPPSTYGGNVVSLQMLNANTGHATEDFGYIHRTTNGGAVWSYQFVASYHTSSIYFVNGGTGYLSSTDGGFWKTVDSGATWNSQSLPYANLNALHFPDFNTGYGVGQGGHVIKHVFLPPNAPGLTTPAQNATNVPYSTNLVWGAVQYKDTYRAQVATDSAFTGIVYDDSTLLSTTTFLDSLLNGTTYYWRVNAKNAGGSGAWSPTQKFTTLLSIAAPPILLAPAQGGTSIPVSTNLTWKASAGAATYRSQVSLDSNFSTLIVNDSTLAVTTRAVGPLAINTVHYWRVNAKNSVGTSAFSARGKFTTLLPLPAVPVLTMPAQNAVNIPVSTSLNWNASSDVVSYRVQLGTDSIFASPLVNDSTLTTTTRAVGPLAYNTAYYWRVNGKNASGTSAYSTIWRFNTPTAASVSSPKIGVRFLNFEGKKFLRFNLLQTSHVLIRLYNSKGEVVAKLVDEMRKPGDYRISVGNDKVNGAYLLDFESEGVRKTIRL